MRPHHLNVVLTAMCIGFAAGWVISGLVIMAMPHLVGLARFLDAAIRQP